MDAADYVCSVPWVKEGHSVAIELSTGKTQLWDVGQHRLVRTMEGVMKDASQHYRGMSRSSRLDRIQE